MCSKVTLGFHDWHAKRCTVETLLVLLHFVEHMNVSDSEPVLFEFV